MHVDIIESYDAFAALQENWNDLYSKDPQAQFFLSWLWLSQVFKMNPHRWIVLAVKQDHADAVCIGFFPLWLKTVWSKSQRQFRNEIHLAGPLPWGYRTGFVCHPDWEEPIIVSFADKLRDMYWSRISLKYLCVSDRRLDLFLDHFNPDNQVAHQTSLDRVFKRKCGKGKFPGFTDIVQQGPGHQ